MPQFNTRIVICLGSVVFITALLWAFLLGPATLIILAATCSASVKFSLADAEFQNPIRSFVVLFLAYVCMSSVGLSYLLPELNRTEFWTVILSLTAGILIAAFWPSGKSKDEQPQDAEHIRGRRIVHPADTDTYTAVIVRRRQRELEDSENDHWAE